MKPNRWMLDVADRLEELLDQPRYEEFELPCPHHVPCASPCQGTAYRRVWT